MRIQALLLAVKILQILLILGIIGSCVPPYFDRDLKFVVVGAIFVAILLIVLAPMSVTFKQLAVTFTLVIVLNLVLTPFFGASALNLTPNFSERVRVVGDVMTGFTGIQLISTDAKGYRTNTSISYEKKPQEAFRIFAIGGSTTEQIHLGDDKTWVAILAANLQRAIPRQIEAINTGVAGLRAEHHLATLRKISGYEPDLVIIMMGVNDWNRHIRRGGNAYVTYFYELTEYLDLRKSLLAKAYKGATTLLTAYRAKAKAAIEREEDGSYLSKQNDSLNRAEHRAFFPKDISSNYRRYVNDIAMFCRSRKVRCVFVDQATAYHRNSSPDMCRRFWLTPPSERYSLSLENMIYISDLYNLWLESFSASVELPFCKLAGKLPPSTASFYDDCHFNEGGARKVAQLLTACILDQSLLAK